MIFEWITDYQNLYLRKSLKEKLYSYARCYNKLARPSIFTKREMLMDNSGRWKAKARADEVIRIIMENSNVQISVSACKFSCKQKENLQWENAPDFLPSGAMLYFHLAYRVNCILRNKLNHKHYISNKIHHRRNRAKGALPRKLD